MSEPGRSSTRMKVLPESTQPATQRIERRHHPRARTGRRGYQSYRACLRWEFGFSCAFCLLHEADMAPLGVEGLGVMGVEHFIAVSADAESLNVYDNCFLACRLCNGARSTALASVSGKHLLNPCNNAWADHFEVDGDRLSARSGDRDAEYTEQTYDFNDPRKVRARRLRRELLSEYLKLVTEGPRRIEILIGLSQKYDDVEILSAAQHLQTCVRIAVKELRAYSAVPADAPDRCQCGLTDDLDLPTWLGRQTRELAKESPT